MRRCVALLALLCLILAACGGGAPAPAGQEAPAAGPVSQESSEAISGAPTGPARVITLAGNGEAATTEGAALEVSFNEPSDLVVDDQGNVYVAEYRGARISKISPDGTVTAIVGNPTGNVDGDRSVARLGTPRGIVLAGDGNLYVSDWDNRAIRRVTLDGAVTTIFTGSFVETLGLTLEGDILASIGPDREQIVRVTLEGDVVPIAGMPLNGGYRDGPADQAQFSYVSGLAMGQDGWIYATEAVSMRSRGGSQLIRSISPHGEVSTLTGGRFVTAYVDGPVAGARFHHPVDIAIRPAGDLFVADSLNHCIRHISPDGIVSTVAGRCGYPGYADGAADEAQFNLPQGLTLDAAGNIYVADARNHRIRKIVFE
jgi:sugar lactone lactonase YvrE